MKMRVPSIPLINIDPYFSVWSHDDLNTKDCVHWTGSRNTIIGTVIIDGQNYRFLGKSTDPVIPQTDIQIDALSTRVTFTNAKIRLTALFTSPTVATDLYYASRPVAYLKLSWESADGNAHATKFTEKHKSNTVAAATAVLVRTGDLFCPFTRVFFGFIANASIHKSKTQSDR